MFVNCDYFSDNHLQKYLNRDSLSNALINLLSFIFIKILN